MFEKLPAGYRLTDAGEQIQEFAEQMEASSNQLETRVFSRDQGPRGRLVEQGSGVLMMNTPEPARLGLAHVGGMGPARVGGH
jgi:DNA-binding transcriptional LysR family regulator